MSEPLNIQLAIQGGGAKLCDLLAAAEAIQELETAKKIHITRLAGASAGAIVACLLASEQQISGVRDYLKSEGNKLIEQAFPLLNRRKLIWKAIWGQPFYYEQPLRKLLGHFFNEKGFRELKNLPKQPVFIVAADIRNGKKEVYSGKEEVIVDCLINSCAVPFFFRTHKGPSPAHIVDGGICENLPVDELLVEHDDQPEGKKDYGLLIGVSFEDMSTPQDPQNPIDFLAALLNTAINNSMRRSKERIGSGHIHFIKTNISTFEWKKALEGLSGDHYDLVKLETKQWLEELLNAKQKPQGSLLGDPWDDKQLQAVEIMQKLSRVFETHHSRRRFEIPKSSLIVVANSLLDQNDPRSKTPDLVKQIRLFSPSAETIQCVRIGLTPGEESGFSGLASWTARDAKGEEIEVIAIPSTGPEPRARDVILFFNPELGNHEGRKPYNITQQDQLWNAMLPLKKDGKDFLCIENIYSNPISRVNLVLFVPKDWSSRISMSGYLHSTKTPAGRKLENREITEYGDWPGFSPLGWSTSDLQPGEELRVEFQRS